MECSRCAVNNLVTAFAQARLPDSMKRCQNRHLLNAIDTLLKAFQNVCLTCSRTSDDDNPSNHGQTFVSLDSGTSRAATGKAHSSHTDDNDVISRADWIAKQASPDSKSLVDNNLPGSRLDGVEKARSHSITTLPPDVEDALRAELSNFSSLDVIDKLIIACVMSGMNLSEFASMRWLPPQIIDPRTRKTRTMTKQAAHARFNNIVRKLPYFKNLVRTIKRKRLEPDVPYKTTLIEPTRRGRKANPLKKLQKKGIINPDQLSLFSFMSLSSTTTLSKKSNLNHDKPTDDFQRSLRTPCTRAANQACPLARLLD